MELKKSPWLEDVGEVPGEVNGQSNPSLWGPLWPSPAPSAFSILHIWAWSMQSKVYVGIAGTEAEFPNHLHELCGALKWQPQSILLLQNICFWKAQHIPFIQRHLIRHRCLLLLTKPARAGNIPCRILGEEQYDSAPGHCQTRALWQRWTISASRLKLSLEISSVCITTLHLFLIPSPSNPFLCLLPSLWHTPTACFPIWRSLRDGWMCHVLSLCSTTEASSH